MSYPCSDQNRRRNKVGISPARIGCAACTLLTCALLLGCGGSGGTPNNPPPPGPPGPTLSSLSPNRILAGGTKGTDLFLLVVGSNFSSSSLANWNGSARRTRFIDATHLVADIPASDFAVGGNIPVTVSNGPGITSNSVIFQVFNRRPTVATVVPANVVSGGPGFTLTVNGTDFVPGSTVLWNGSIRTTTLVSTSQVTAPISAADIATVQTAQITVTSPGPGGGPSNFEPLSVLAPQPFTITTSRLPDSGSNKVYYFTLYSAGGIVPIQWGITSGVLPPSLSLDGATGLIAGVVSSAPGSFNVTISANDSSSPPRVASKALSITVQSSLGRNDVCTAGSEAGTTTISNGRLRASISPYGDIDVYSFRGTAGSQITAETFAQRLILFGNRSYLDSVLELLDGNCNQIAVNDDLSADPHVQDSRIESFTLPATGTYFLRVRDFRGDGRPDLIYDLSLTGAD